MNIAAIRSYVENHTATPANEPITDVEIVAVNEWCREWCLDVVDDFDDYVNTERGTDYVYFARVNVEGGLDFILADVRRMASELS